MANPAFVQNLGTAATNNGSSGSTFTSLTISSVSVTTGDDIVVLVLADTTTTTGWSISDGTNTYNADYGPTNASMHLTWAVFRAHNCTLSAGTITITIPTTTEAAAVAIELSGILSSSATESEVSASGSSTSPASGNSTATSVANDLAIGCVFFQAGPSNVSSFTETISSTTSGYTAASSAQATFGSAPSSSRQTAGLFPYYQASIANGTTLSFGGTLGTSANWVSLVYAYKAPASADPFPAGYGHPDGAIGQAQMQQMLAGH